MDNNFNETCIECIEPTAASSTSTVSSCKVTIYSWILINSQGTNQGNETMADFSYRTV